VNETIEDTSSFTSLQTLIYEAIRFSDWAAGEGIHPVDTNKATDPSDFLMEYSRASGDEEWDTYAFRIAIRVGTLPLESVEDPSEYLPTNSTQTLVSGL